MVQPYPIDASSGTAGLLTSFLTDEPPREAVRRWAKAQGWGWFHLERGSNYCGSVLFRLRWPANPGRSAQMRGEVHYRVVTSPAGGNTVNKFRRR